MYYDELGAAVRAAIKLRIAPMVRALRRADNLVTAGPAPALSNLNNVSRESLRISQVSSSVTSAQSGVSFDSSG
jgi:hypothetical protein